MLEESDVSGRHIKVARDDNRVHVEDLDSRNGNYLNARRIQDRQFLKHLNVIQLGKCVLVYNESDSILDDSIVPRGDDTVETFGLRTSRR